MEKIVVNPKAKKSLIEKYGYKNVSVALSFNSNSLMAKEIRHEAMNVYKGVILKKKFKPVRSAPGDFIRNEIKRMGDKVQPYPLGYDKYYDAQYTPGNTQFIINCVNYLCADEGLISLRMRELKSRTLNATKVREEKAMWICVNIIVPVLIVLLIGFTMIVMRKVKYSKKEK